MRLDGRVALVTGGASGIGEATVRRFVAEGAAVVIADVQVDRGVGLADELDGRARFVATDVTDEEQVARAVDVAVAELGRLDVVFNNAGVIGAVGPVADVPVDEFDFTLAVNLRGTFLGMKHAARVMVPRRRGVILSTTSPAGLVGGLGPHAYSAAKAAVVGLTRSVAAELRPHGIRVNAISPGATTTPMTAAIRTGDPDALDRTATELAEDSPMGRAGSPDDVAAAAAYLASDEASFVTATVLEVDAGLVGAPGSSRFTTAELAAGGLLREAGRRGRPT